MRVPGGLGQDDGSFQYNRWQLPDGGRDGWRAAAHFQRVYPGRWSTVSDSGGFNTQVYGNAGALSIASGIASGIAANSTADATTDDATTAVAAVEVAVGARRAAASWRATGGGWAAPPKSIASQARLCHACAPDPVRPTAA